MSDSFLSHQSSVSVAAVLIANKIVNFLFVASVLLFIDDSFDLGPTVIQATALSGILVAFVSPFFYTVLSSEYDHNARTTIIDVCLAVVYVAFLLVLLLSLFLKSSILFILLLALSLAARGICDAIVSVEGLVLARSLIILCVVEPIRWGIYITADNDDFFLILVLLSLPVVTDMAIRFKSYLNIELKSVAISTRIAAKLVRLPQLRTAYGSNLVSQSEQLFIFFWSSTLSATQSLAYILAMQIVGFLMLFYLPYWMKLLQRSMDLSPARKTKIIHEHMRFIYKTQCYLVIVTIIFMGTLFLFEPISDLLTTLMDSISLLDQFTDISIFLIIMLVVVIILFKSIFMDINLLATVSFYHQKVALTYSIFLVGLIITVSGLAANKSFSVLIGIYLLSYAVSVLYRTPEVFKR
jgi:hypothetical protein